mmetsp:Transcript_17318/g.36603  ORF Transcript_17318/g.36603 Transcript_17318/m.36603 type:complete len:338 (+) Transcript_17318:65-1078(+)
MILPRPHNEVTRTLQCLQHITSKFHPALFRQSPNYHRTLSSSPFYGNPLPPSSRYLSPRDRHSKDQNLHQKQGDNHRNPQHCIPSLSPLQRIATLIHSSVTALNDPTRADAVAAVGEVTGSFALSKIMRQMENDPVGRRILKERPLVNETVADRAFALLESERNNLQSAMVETHSNISNKDNTLIDEPKSFGAAYAKFLKSHGYHPNERDPIRFITDPDLAYVMTRYRQSHDYWHALTGLPPTVLGELALKWLELFQTGMPLAALSATGGAFGVSGLSATEKEILWEVYFPWAARVGGRRMKEGSLMCVYYEEEFETGLEELRDRLGIEAAPVVDLL